jgi:hypothetical protein
MMPAHTTEEVVGAFLYCIVFTAGYVSSLGVKVHHTGIGRALVVSPFRHDTKPIERRG